MYNLIQNMTSGEAAFWSAVISGFFVCLSIFVTLSLYRKQARENAIADFRAKVIDTYQGFYPLWVHSDHGVPAAIKGDVYRIFAAAEKLKFWIKTKELKEALDSLKTFAEEAKKREYKFVENDPNGIENRKKFQKIIETILNSI